MILIYILQTSAITNMNTINSIIQQNSCYSLYNKNLAHSQELHKTNQRIVIIIGYTNSSPSTKEYLLL